MEYYTAHRGAVFGADGKFNHFARQCDPVHLKYGYWKFSTCDDDRRAFLRGLTNPEEVLQAQDAGDNDYDDIMLRWVPGELDTNNKSLVGTAAAHLQSICNERKSLGKTLSFRGAVPLYPLSTDPKLLRVARYGVQKGVLSSDLLSKTTLPRDLSQSQIHSSTDRLLAPLSSVSHLTNRVSSAVATPSPTTSSLPTQSNTARLLDLDQVPASLRPGYAPIPSSSPIVTKEPVQAKARSGSLERLQVFSPTSDYRMNSPLYAQEISEEFMDSTPSTNLTNNSATPKSEKRFLFKDGDESGCMQDSGVVADDATEDVSYLSLASSTPVDLFHANVAALPCMDCGVIGTHAVDCWIKGAMLEPKIDSEFTTSELNGLADDVKRFDPGPWTTHYGSQQEHVEDTATQIKGMAEIIRHLDSNVDYPELIGLDDESTILFWAVKSVGEVQVLGGDSEQADFEMVHL